MLKLWNYLECDGSVSFGGGIVIRPGIEPGFEL